VKKLLDVWPPLPITIYARHPAGKLALWGATNLMAALKQQNRVRGAYILGVPNSLLKKIRVNEAISGSDKSASFLK